MFSAIYENRLFSTYLPKAKPVFLLDQPLAGAVWSRSRWQIARRYDDPNFAPIEWFNLQGAYSGVTADYLRILEQRQEISFEVLTRAIFATQEFKPDLIMLDVRMPDMTGDEVAAQLKGDPELERQRVLDELEELRARIERVLAE